MSRVVDKLLKAIPTGLLDASPPENIGENAENFHLIRIDGCVVDNLLSPKECARIIDACEDAGFTFWDPAGANEESVRVRNAHTIEFSSSDLCDALWKRLQPFVPPNCRIEEGQERWQADLAEPGGSEWHACGLNTHLLVNRYEPGGHFSPHADGSTEISFDKRSLYTVLLYLNDVYDGGGTQLLNDPGDMQIGMQAEHSEKELQGKLSN